MAGITLVDPGCMRQGEGDVAPPHRRCCGLDESFPVRSPQVQEVLPNMDPPCRALSAVTLEIVVEAPLGAGAKVAPGRPHGAQGHAVPQTAGPQL